MRLFLMSGLLNLMAALATVAQPVHPPAALPPADPVPMPAAKADPAAKTYPRGHKHPDAATLQKRHVDAFKRHDHRVKHLPTATPAAFDCRTLGWVGPVQDQGQCGSCWDVSATGVVTNAYIKAGLAKNDGSFVLSPQYVLDCGQNGGCDGDDAPTVLDMAKSKGLPTSADYGPYTAGPGRCKFNNQKLYTIQDWGFCTPNQSQGMAAVQNIKDCLVRFGPLSTAVAADSSWDGIGADGVIPYRKLGANSIDHDISIVGWDDAKKVPGAPAAGAWLCLNQWGDRWGAGGYMWIGYGSHQIGYEAAWVSVAPLPPPPAPGPTPDPVPPTPVPPTPVPPGPSPAGGYTGKIATVQEYADGKPVGTPTTVVGYTGQAASAVGEDLKAAGISPATILAVLHLLADVRAKAGKDAILADLLAVLASL